MYYLKCKIVEILPNYIIAEVNNVAYRINFSNSSTITQGEEILIYIFQEFRLDMKNQIGFHLYGFLSKTEIELFHFLISIKGIGCKTAQIILTNDLHQLATLITRKDSISLSKLKGLNWTLANSLIYGISQSKNIRNMLISLTRNNQEEKETKLYSWDENEVINSLIEIGYKWEVIKQALDTLKKEQSTYPDNNSVINKCLQTISQTQKI